MNRDILMGKWKEVKGEIRKQWGRLTDDELDQVKGNEMQLSGLIQKKYGLEKDEASKKLSDIFRKYNDAPDKDDTH